MSPVDRLTIRSYGRIFRPDRRIYRIEGHQLPVPGGVPLAWLGTFVATLLGVLLLSTRSLVFSVLLALAATVIGWAVGGRSTALLLGGTVLVGTQLVGLLLGAIDWPLRLVVLPAGLATLAGQATPDGRPAHRFARSWLMLRLRPARRSLGRPLPPAGSRRSVGGEVWAAPDHRRGVLGRGRVSGPARVRFRVPVVVVDGRVRGRAYRTARPSASGAPAVVGLEYGERLEVRP